MVLSIQNNPRRLWRQLQTTNAIEPYFVEVRRRTRPMAVFTNVESVDRIIYAIFSRFDENWKPPTHSRFTQAARCHRLVRSALACCQCGRAIILEQGKAACAVLALMIYNGLFNLVQRSIFRVLSDRYNLEGELQWRM
jgi:hypothetical protein